MTTGKLVILSWIEYGMGEMREALGDVDYDEATDNMKSRHLWSSQTTD
jgi:hypothetical protein